MTTKRLIPFLEKELGPVNFAMYMRVSRNTLELTQTEMAKKLKISKSSLCDIEKSRQTPSLALAIKIVKMARLSEKMAVRYWLQDQVERAKLKFKVDIAA